MSSRFGIGQIIPPFFAVLALAAIGFFGAPWTVETIVTLFAIAVAADALAHAWKNLPRPDAYGWGGLSAIAMLMILRTAWFYAGWNLNGWGDIVPLMGVIAATGIWRIFCQREKRDGWKAGSGEREADFVSPASRLPLAVYHLVLPLLSAVGLALVAYGAFHAATETTVRTPWQLLPPWTLPIISILFILPILSAWRGANRWIIALQAACAMASVTVLAPLVYTIGYGFDGFLHVAGERVLLETGILSPKPMYYMGQYVTTAWMTKITELDIGAIDRWLVPIVSALLIPFALASKGCSGVQLFGYSPSSSNPNTRASAVILLPFSAFIATTPNGFAVTLAAAALIACAAPLPVAIPLLLATWAALTHPLVGLPVLTAILGYSVIRLFGYSSSSSNPNTRTSEHPNTRISILRILAILLALLSGFMVPIVFGLASSIGSQGANFTVGKLADANAWASLASQWMPYVTNHFSLWADASLWIEKILPLFILALALISVISKKKTDATIFLFAAASAAAAAILLQLAGDFGFLIDYERGNYAARLWTVAWILLLPAAIPTFGTWIDRARRAGTASMAAVLIVVGLIGAGSAYAALPRHDAATPSRGWSVGAADIEAVKLIDRDAAGAAYTVLANQSVSAAAVRAFGFKRYNGDVFFYPIPTGGVLYEVFLTASYGNPSRDTMAKAGDLGGTRLVYFVVNDYWWKHDELIEAARASADRVFEVANGKTIVFRYDIE